MKVFVDVGSHIGQTIEEVTKPRWGFDQIHAIEPMPAQVAVLTERFGADPRVCIWPIALSDHDGELVMYGSNAFLEASIWPEKNDVDERFHRTVECWDASRYFGLFPAETDLYVNMNCEGAEIGILEWLLFTGEAKRITHLLVDFDIAKVPGQEPSEYRVRKALDMAGVSYDAAYADRPTHQEQIEAWLLKVRG